MRIVGVQGDFSLQAVFTEDLSDVNTIACFEELNNLIWKNFKRFYFIEIDSNQSDQVLREPLIGLF